MSTLKDNLIKIGFKADEADTILEKMPAADQQNYSSFSMPELALKAGNFKNQYLKKATVLKKKLTIPDAPEEEDTTTMVFKRSTLPDAAVDTQSVTSTNKPTLDMNATGVVNSSSKLQKAGSSINLQKPGGSLLDSNIAPAKPAPSLNKPGSNLKKPGTESALPHEEADMGIPTMSFKRDSLPGAAKDINSSQQLSKTPGSTLNSLNNTAPASTNPESKPAFKLKGGSLKKPGDNKSNADDALAGMDLNTMTMSKSAILGSAVDIASDSHSKKPGSSLSMPNATPPAPVEKPAEETPSEVTPEVVPPKVKPKLALKGNKGMITPPGSGLELPKPGSSSKAPGITSPSSGLSSPGGLQAPSGELKAPGALQAPSGGLKAPGSLTPPAGDLPPPPPPGGLSLKTGSEVHSPGDLAEGHDKKLSLNSPEEDSTQTPHEDISETVTTSLNKLKKTKPSKSGKKPLVVMAAIGILLLGGIAFLLTTLLGGSDEADESDLALKEKSAAKVPVKKKVVKVEEKFKAFDIAPSREWAYRTASPLKFDLKEASKDSWTLEFWLNLPEDKDAESVRLINLKLQDEIVLMLKLNDGNFCVLKSGEENHKASKAFRTGKTQYHLALSYKNNEVALHINGRYIAKVAFDKSFDSIMAGNDKLALSFDEMRLSSSALYLAEENFIPSRTLERDEESLLYIPFEAHKDTAVLNIYYPKELTTLAIDSNSWSNIKQSVLDISALLSELDNEIIDDEGSNIR